MLATQVNPQWQEGQVISDFGFFGRKAAEEFLAGASACTCTAQHMQAARGQPELTAAESLTAAGFEDVYFVRVYTIAGEQCFRKAGCDALICPVTLDHDTCYLVTDR